MKKFALQSTQYGITKNVRVLHMTDKAFAEYKKNLDLVQKDCRTRNFDNAEDPIYAMLQLMDRKEVAKDGCYKVAIIESNDEYARSCKFSMICTRVIFEVENGKITSATPKRSCTGESVIRTACVNTACEYIAKKITRVSFKDLAYNKEVHTAIENLATAIHGEINL